MSNEELLDRLDPDLDYGNRTLAEVRAEVEAGTLVLSEAKETKQPVVRRAGSRAMVRGSGDTEATRDSATDVLNAALQDYVVSGGGAEKMVALVDKMLTDDDASWKARADALNFLADRTLGRPKDHHRSDVSPELAELLRRMAAGELNEHREIPQLPVYTREVAIEVPVVDEPEAAD